MQLTVFNQQYGLYRAKTPSGIYSVSDSAAVKYRDVCDIKYTPSMPPDEDYSSIFARVKLLEEEHGSFNHPDQWRWWAYISPSDIGYTQSLTEAQMLINMLEEGDTDLPFEEILLEGGFKEREILMHYPNRINATRQFEHSLKSNFRIFLDDAFHLVYDTGPRWYNILRLQGDHLGEGNQTLIPSTYPNTVKDYRRVAAKHTVWNITQRLERKGKRRLYMPLS